MTISKMAAGRWSEGQRESIYRRLPISLQTVALNWEAWRKNRLRFDSVAFRERTMVFRRLARASTDEIERWQLAALRSLVGHAQHSVPWYRNRFVEARVDPHNIRTLDDFRQLPIVKRDELREHNAEFVAPSEWKNHVRTATTSGTTGSPLKLHWDRESEWWNTAAYGFHRSWFSYERGDRYASITGRQVVPLSQKRPPYWRTNFTSKQLLLSSYHLSEETIPRYIEALRRFRPTTLEAYPSTAWLLARFLTDKKETLPLKAVHLSAEPLLRFQREVIEEAFACHVFDYYGCSERVLAAGECSAHDGLHIFAPFGMTEILDENDRPCPPGVHGRLVLTGFHNRLMPLIRYDIGDTSAFVEGQCPCGCPWPKINAVTTKAEDIIVTPDGRMLSPSTLHYPFMSVNSVATSQIIQEAVGQVRVKIVRRPNFGPRDSSIIRAGLQDRLGKDCHLEFEFVDEIPREGRGKFRWVISKVPLKLGHGSMDNLYTGSS